MEEGFDTFCLRPADGEALTHVWRALRPAVNGVSTHQGAQ
jgi:hypothetical protein